MYRKTPTSENELAEMLRSLHDRLDKLESGGAIAGNISLEKLHRLYDVQVEITDDGSGHRTITYTSPAGVSYSIPL